MICIKVYFTNDLTLFHVVLNGFVQPTMTNGDSGSGFHEYQIQFVKNLIDDSLDEFRYVGVCLGLNI